ncbi:MAG: hypothetical protein ABSF83_12400 [Nitrososphaerales archaeon]
MDDADVGKPRLVRRKVFENRPRLCPVCLTPLKKLSGLGGWLIPQDYLCPSCGYRGYAFLEELPDAEKKATASQRAAPQGEEPATGGTGAKAGPGELAD